MPVPSNQSAQLTPERREELIREVAQAFFDRQPKIRDALLRRGERLAEIAVDLIAARLLTSPPE